MSDMFFKLGPDADSTIALYPEWDYENGLKKIEKKHRLQNADLYVYKTGEYEEIEIKAKFMPLSDAAIINSWWQSNASLVYYQREKDFRDWSFENTTHIWSGTYGCTVTVNNSVAIIEQNSAGGRFSTIETISFQGCEYYKISVRLRKINSDPWGGYLFYTTTGVNSHGIVSSYVLHNSNEPIGVDSYFVVAEWDMRSLTVGGNDWINSEITGLEFAFFESGSGYVYVDYVDVGYKHSSVTSVMIRNTKKPFAKYQEPYADYMQGTIKLEGY